MQGDTFGLIHPQIGVYAPVSVVVNETGRYLLNTYLLFCIISVRLFLFVFKVVL